VPWRPLRYSYLDLPFGAGNGPAHSSTIDTLVSGAEVDGGYGRRFEDALDKNVIWSCFDKVGFYNLAGVVNNVRGWIQRSEDGCEVLEGPKYLGESR
jgi:hypothetical protein